jgi:predicted Zn-dependent peptidase
MLEFKKFTLKNGLKVIFHQDKTTPIVAMNVLYNVGAKDENPNRTGFAHLFEHLMFGGSINIPEFDKPLEKAGGTNNAFTNSDITNYYLSIPKTNIETAFWLESDRMLNLAFSEKSLEVQRNVVIEEYKQRYLNQPYGDIWLLLRPMVYKKHPYQWNTIGKDISHIEEASMKDVKEFYDKFYTPQNANLVIAGDLNLDQVVELSKKWFEPIEKNFNYVRNLDLEPEQTEMRFLEVERNVPSDAIFLGFKMRDRFHQDYYATDLISDVLSNGKSGRLYQNLVKEKKLFSTINAFISGEIEEGMFFIGGFLSENITHKQAHLAINSELNSLKNELISEREIQKVQNKIKSNMVLSQTDIVEKSMNLAFYELLGDANLFNIELDKYLNVERNDIQRVSQNLFDENKSSVIYYKKK